MAYNNKRKYIEQYDPDITVIQECSQNSLSVEDSLWFGDTPSKGIGIVFRDNIDFQLVTYYSHDFKWVIPVQVRMNDKDFIIFAVWLKNDKKFAYSGHFIQAMDYYLPLIKDKNVIIIGDFNSNSIWDKKHRSQGNHTALVNMLEKEGIISTYHKY